MNQEAKNALLNSELDMTVCLSNCTNNGMCFINQFGNYECRCFEGFSGSICATNQRPCSTNPCINNGDCQNILIENEYSFYCNCSYPYFGEKCE